MLSQCLVYRFRAESEPSKICLLLICSSTFRDAKNISQITSLTTRFCSHGAVCRASALPQKPRSRERAQAEPASSWRAAQAFQSARLSFTCHPSPCAYAFGRSLRDNGLSISLNIVKCFMLRVTGQPLRQSAVISIATIDYKKIHSAHRCRSPQSGLIRDHVSSGTKS